MKKVEAVVAVIYENGKILVTQRGYGKFSGFWEFPGGKIENGEAREHALKREIMEELGTDIIIEKYIKSIEYNYDDFYLILYCYQVTIVNKNIQLLEKQKQSLWCDAIEIKKLKWLPANIDFVNNIEKYLD